MDLKQFEGKIIFLCYIGSNKLQLRNGLEVGEGKVLQIEINKPLRALPTETKVWARIFHTCSCCSHQEKFDKWLLGDEWTIDCDHLPV